jgi:hypothetical protein
MVGERGREGPQTGKPADREVPDRPSHCGVAIPTLSDPYTIRAPSRERAFTPCREGTALGRRQTSRLIQLLIQFLADGGRRRRSRVSNFAQAPPRTSLFCSVHSAILIQSP